jgi:DNA-binding SARP family transcriptional activator
MQNASLAWTGTALEQRGQIRYEACIIERSFRLFSDRHGSLLDSWILYGTLGNVSITVEDARGTMIGLFEQRLHAVASKRNGAALGLCGDPGIGKSHSTHQLLRGLSCRSASVHAINSNSSILRALPSPANVPVWLERALEQFARSSMSAKVFAETLGAFLAVLGPFVLHVEDLHEANPEQRDGWLLLAQQITRTRGVALIVTSRVVLPEPFETITLEPLGLSDTTRLLEAEAGAKLPSEAITWIEGYAQGNPMFTLEYFRHLSRIGALWSDGTRWRWRAPNDQEMPTSVEAVISQHLRNVMALPEARAGLQAKAVLPLEVADTLWAQVAGLHPSELHTAKLELEDHGILRAGRFAHPLYREAVLEELLPAERQVLAERTLESLQTYDPVAALPALEAAGWPKNKELDLLERALAQAQASHDLAMQAQVTSLLAEHTSGTERTRLRLESVRLMREVNPVAALELAQTTRRLDPFNLELNCVCAELLADLRRPVEAEHLLADTKQLLTSSTDRHRWLLARFEVRHYNRDYVGMIELWHERQRLEPDDCPNFPVVAVARAFALLRRADEAYEVLTEAMAREDLTSLELMELLFVRCFIPHFEGHLIESEKRLNDFLETIESLDDPSARMGALRCEGYSLRALAHNGLDQPQAALEDELKALEYPVAMGMGSQYAEQQNYLALFLLETGEYQRAEEIMFEIRPILERNGNAIPLSMLERFAARLYLEWDVPHGGVLALRHAQASLRLMESAGRNAAYLGGALIVATWAEALYGQPNEALRLIDELVEYTHSIKNPHHLGIVAWLRGLTFERLERIPEAIASLQEAASSTVVLHVGPSHQRICLDLDRITGNVNSARKRLTYFRERGMGNAQKVTLRFFPQLAETPAVIPEGNTIRLEVLGPMAINGKVISGRSKKGKELLAMLLHARLNKRDELNDLELLDTLYPDLNEESAGSALRQLVYRLRSSIGADVIVRTGNGYTLGEVQTDVEEFLTGASTQLWRGPFLSGLEDSWAGSVRSTVTQALRNTVKGLIERDPVEALRLARILIEVEPYDHVALELGLRAAQAAQDSLGAKSLYNSTRKRFGEVGEPLPEDWTQWLEEKTTR